MLSLKMDVEKHEFVEQSEKTFFGIDFAIFLKRGSSHRASIYLFFSPPVILEMSFMSFIYIKSYECIKSKLSALIIFSS